MASKLVISLIDPSCLLEEADDCCGGDDCADDCGGGGGECPYWLPWL